MQDLISRQAAIDDIWTVSPLACLDRKWVDRWLRQLPSAQPEIIYCKDCGHRDDHGCCKYWKGLAMSETPIATDDYDFCNHAKRREHE